MKTFYGIALFLLCFIVSYSDILAVDVTIKTNLTRTRTETVSAGATSASCGGGAPAAPQVFTFDVTVVDSVTTQFTVRVVEKENTSNVVAGPSTHAIVNGVNYNLATGELTHTITGVPSSKKILLVQLYKGGSASGTPYFEQEISTARGTKVQSGVLDIGDIGNNSTGTSGAGGVVTGGSKSSDASSSTITVNIETQEDANYVVLLTMQSQGSALLDNDIQHPVIISKGMTSFQVYIEQTADVTQNLRLNVMIQGYQ